MENSRQFVEVLKKNGVRCDFRETEGNHSWPVWRRYLADFAPCRFRRGSNVLAARLGSLATCTQDACATRMRALRRHWHRLFERFVPPFARNA